LVKHDQLILVPFRWYKWILPLGNLKQRSNQQNNGYQQREEEKKPNLSNKKNGDSPMATT
jgi:hypothetical protein